MMLKYEIYFEIPKMKAEVDENMETYPNLLSKIEQSYMEEFLQNPWRYLKSRRVNE